MKYVEDWVEMTTRFKEVKGEERTLEENKMFFCITPRDFQRQLCLTEVGEGREMYFINISQDSILKEISSFYQICQDYIRRLLNHFWEYGKV